MPGLHDAARDGDLATIKRLLADGTASIDERTEDGNTALTLAAGGGQIATIKWLLEFGGSSISEKCRLGRTALISAVVNDEIAVVQWLLTMGGANITDATNDGLASLDLAAFGGYTAMTQWLITEGRADVTHVANDGLTALGAALLQGHYALARLLIEEGGAKINQTDSAGVRSVWTELLDNISESADTADLAALLKVMVLLDDAPANVIAVLSPAHAKIAKRGRQLRAQLPSYLEQQRTLVVAHCPLPSALQPLVAGYAAPTPEDMWAEGGLRVWAPRAKRARAMVGAVVGVDAPFLRRSVRLRQKRG
jgi:hypothetical protein